MNKKEQENIDKVKKLKNKIIKSNTRIETCKENIAYLDNEKKNETENCLKMIKIFGIEGILCLIVASIVGEAFLILPGIFPIGIGLPTASIYLAIETLIINKKKKTQEKIVVNTEIEKTQQIEKLENLLKNIKKQEISKAKEILNIESNEPQQEKENTEIIDNLISELVEAKRFGILEETLHNKYNIYNQEIIDLFKELINEEVELQRSLFRINNCQVKVHTK